MSRLFDPFRSLPEYKPIGEDKFQSRCPSHNDHSPSLRGTLTADRLLIRCWAGCTGKDVLRAMGLAWADLFLDGARGPTPASRKTRSAMRGFQEWREREWSLTRDRLRAYDRFIGLGPWETLSQVQRAFLGAACRDYCRMEQRLETLRTGTNEECLVLYRESSQVKL